MNGCDVHFLLFFDKEDNFVSKDVKIRAFSAP